MITLELTEEQAEVLQDILSRDMGDPEEEQLVPILWEKLNAARVAVGLEDYRE